MALTRIIQSDFLLLSYYVLEFREWLEVAVLAYNITYCIKQFD
jgi:hypothetical protein